MLMTVLRVRILWKVPEPKNPSAEPPDMASETPPRREIKTEFSVFLPLERMSLDTLKSQLPIPK
jgi:hypothetical protein